MEFDDIKYLSTAMANLAGIPIRIYSLNNNEKLFYYSIVKLPVDPIIPYREEIFKASDHVTYYITPAFHYYGILNTPEYKIILGPSNQRKLSKKELSELAFECSVPNDEIDDFVFGMESLVRLPLNSIIQMLCSMNLVLNNEKLSLSDVMIFDERQRELSNELAAKETNDAVKKDFEIENTQHNTTDLEETIMAYVSHGDTSALNDWLKQAPAIREGIVSFDELRQLKNMFIVTATLTSRAAIRGGLNKEEALSLSDSYIQKCELLSAYEAINNLQFHMIIDYTKRVEKIRFGKNPSKLIIEVSNYVQKHLSEPVDIEKMSKNLYISRTYLATKFKKETGMTLSDYVINEKINEAKRLISYTDKDISHIASYLGFSSQSHFSNAFKKVAGRTPLEYRKKHQF